MPREPGEAASRVLSEHRAPAPAVPRCSQSTRRAHASSAPLKNSELFHPFQSPASSRSRPSASTMVRPMRPVLAGCVGPTGPLGRTLAITGIRDGERLVRDRRKPRRSARTRCGTGIGGCAPFEPGHRTGQHPRRQGWRRPGGSRGPNRRDPEHVSLAVPPSRPSFRSDRPGEFLLAGLAAMRPDRTGPSSHDRGPDRLMTPPEEAESDAHGRNDAEPCREPTPTHGPPPGCSATSSRLDPRSARSESPHPISPNRPGPRGTRLRT